jgi:hypothetical protein
VFGVASEKIENHTCLLSYNFCSRDRGTKIVDCESLPGCQNIAPFDAWPVITNIDEYRSYHLVQFNQ